MTVSDCIARFNYIKPHGYDDDTLADWLMALEDRLKDEIFSRYEYQLNEEEGVLSVPYAYSDLYIYYLQAQVDYFDGETARYYNSMNMFNSALRDFSDAFNRAHTPKQKEVRI